MIINSLYFPFDVTTKCHFIGKNIENEYISAKYINSSFISCQTSNSFNFQKAKINVLSNGIISNINNNLEFMYNPYLEISNIIPNILSLIIKK